MQTPSSPRWRWPIFFAVQIPGILGLALLGSVAFLFYCLIARLGTAGRRELPEVTTPLGIIVRWNFTHPFVYTPSAQDGTGTIVLNGICNWMLWSVVWGTVLAIAVTAIVWASTLLMRGADRDG